MLATILPPLEENRAIPYSPSSVLTFLLMAESSTPRKKIPLAGKPEILKPLTATLRIGVLTTGKPSGPARETSPIAQLPY